MAAPTAVVGHIEADARTATRIDYLQLARSIEGELAKVKALGDQLQANRQPKPMKLYRLENELDTVARSLRNVVGILS